MKVRRSAGFTLVELAVVVAVAGIALTATAGAVTSGARLARTNTETRAAMRASQSLMEWVRATPFADLTSTFNGRTYAMKDLGCAESSGTCAVTLTNVDTTSTRWRVFQVNVAATWRGASGTVTKYFSTYICDRTDGSALSTSQTTMPIN